MKKLRRRFLIIIILLFIKSITVYSQSIEKTICLDNELEIHYLSETVQVVTHSFPWPANNAVVVLSDSDILLIDTPYTPEATAKVVNWIESEHPMKKIIAINTGFHFDNLGGNELLKKLGIPIWGSEETVELIQKYGERSRALFISWLSAPRMKKYRDRYNELEYSPPDHLFKLRDGKNLIINGEKVQIYFPGETHTRDNVVVYIPSKQVLFGGCMILSGDSVGNTQDANMNEWANSVEKLQEFNARILIPGHGLRFDYGLIENTINILHNTK